MKKLVFSIAVMALMAGSAFLANAKTMIVRVNEEIKYDRELDSIIYIKDINARMTIMKDVIRTRENGETSTYEILSTKFDDENSNIIYKIISAKDNVFTFIVSEEFIYIFRKNDRYILSFKVDNIDVVE